MPRMKTSKSQYTGVDVRRRGAFRQVGKVGKAFKPGNAAHWTVYKCGGSACFANYGVYFIELHP